MAVDQLTLDRQLLCSHNIFTEHDRTEALRYINRMKFGKEGNAPKVIGRKLQTPGEALDLHQRTKRKRWATNYMRCVDALHKLIITVNPD